MIGNDLRPTYSAEKNRVMAAYFLFPVARHHLAMASIVIATGKIELIELKIDCELPGRSFQHAHAFRHNLFADAVAWNYRNSMSAHKQSMMPRAGHRLLVRCDKIHAGKFLYSSMTGTQKKGIYGEGLRNKRHPECCVD